MRAEDVDSLLAIPSRDAVCALAEVCKDSLLFHAYVDSAVDEVVAIDKAGLRMVILTSLQMGIEQGKREAAMGVAK